MNGNGAVPVRHEVEEGEISLQDIAHILLKGKWIILTSVVLVTLAVAIYTFTRAPEYEATSVLLVNTQQSAPQLGELLGLETGNRNINNEVEILKSRTNALRVADRLLERGRVIRGDSILTVLRDDDGNLLSRNEIAERLREDYINVRPLGRDVDLIQITSTSTVPSEASLIANLYAETFRDYNRSSSRSRMTASREFLDEITNRFSEQLKVAEDELTEFLNQEKIVEPDEEAKQLLQQVGELQSLQYQTQLQLGMAQVELKSLEDELDKITPGLASQLSSSDDVMIDGLKQQITRLQIEEQQIYARNPELRNSDQPSGRLAEIRRELGELTRQLDQRAERLVSSAMDSGTLAAGSMPAGSLAASQLQAVQQLRRQLLEKNVEVSGHQARLDIINDELDAYKRRLAEIPSKAIVLQRLQRSRQSQEQIYLTLIEKMQEARIAEQSELGYIDIIDEAVVPEKPVRPRIPLNLMLGFTLGLMLGIGLAFVRNALDTKIRKPEDLQDLGQNVLGVLPDMTRMIKKEFDGRENITVGSRLYDTGLVTLLSPLSTHAESYRRLRTNIQFSRPDGEPRVILVTSTSQGDGKSLTALNLAVAMAQSGRRTLMIDGDLRRSRVHHMIDLPRSPGLVELLFETDHLPLSRFSTQVDNLFVVPSGRKVPNPADVVGSRKMRHLMELFKEDFEVIIVDAPPVLAVADPILLAAHAEVAILIVSTNQTDRRALLRAIDALKQSGVTIAGTVLNRFDASAAYAGYGYGYGYEEQYEYADDGELRPKRKRKHGLLRQS